MGLFNDLKNFWGAKKAENQARIVSANRIAEIMEMAREDDKDEWQLIVEKNMGATSRDLAEESNSVVNTRSEGGSWEILGSAYKGHIARDQQIMVAQARRFFRFDPNAQAAIYGLLDYLMGHGVNITPKSKDPRVWKLWRQFWTNPENNMDVRQFEIFKRIFRDGETFLRYFNKDANKAVTWQTIIRFMDPIDVMHGTQETENDTDKTNQGIIFDPNDAEKPVAYFMRDRLNPGQEHKIPADQVQHVKYPVADMDQPRGESAIQAVMELFTHYKQWLKNRIILNKLRTAIFAVRKIDMQSGQSVNQLAQSLPTSARSSGGETKKQNIRPGTLYTPPPGVSIEMQSANINASDVKEDGRNMVLQMCAGTRLPEFMFGDASNANYSSTMMAESPFVKHIHFLQSYFEATVWRPMFRKVIQNAVDAGKLKAPDEEDIFADPELPSEKKLTEVDSLNADGNTPEDKSAGKDKPAGKQRFNSKGGKTDKQAEPQQEQLSESETELFYGCDVEWPEIIHREPKEMTEALVLARNEGWISDKTASEKLGFDYGEEVRKQNMIEEEAESIGNSLLDHAAGDAQAFGEEQDGADQQSKEEAMLAAAAAAKAGKAKQFGKNGKGE